MATAKTIQTRDRQPSRWGRNLVLLAVIVAVALTAWFWTRMRAAALTNTAYAAQAGCQCRYAAGRPLAACKADPGVAREWVGLHEDASTRSLTASVPALASQTARWTVASGCMLDVWDE